MITVVPLSKRKARPRWTSAAKPKPIHKSPTLRADGQAAWRWAEAQASLSLRRAASRPRQVPVLASESSSRPAAASAGCSPAASAAPMPPHKTPATHASVRGGPVVAPGDTRSRDGSRSPHLPTRRWTCPGPYHCHNACYRQRGEDV